MAKAKERLDAEAKLNMTKKQKLDNFWVYYKLHVIGGLCAALVLGLLIYDMATQVDDDYTIGLITPYALTQDTLIGMEDALTLMADDRNGDGAVNLRVSHYQLSSDPQSDPMTQMAGTTRLSGDISVNASMIYIVDTPQEYLHIINGLFTYNDGSAIAETGVVDVENFGQSISEVDAFAQVYAIENLKDARVVMVDRNRYLVQKDEELIDYYNDAQLIYEMMLD